MAGSDTIRGWARDVRRFADLWPTQAADLLAVAVDKQLRADTGGDGKFSHDDAGPAAVDVAAGRGSADVLGAGAMGVWAILERGTKRGVRPRRTWTRGVAQGMPVVERDGSAAWAKVAG